MNTPRSIRILVVGTCLVATMVLIACGKDERLESAAVLLDLGKTEEAASVLDAVIHDDPKNAEAHVMLGRAFAETGDLDQADEAFNTAIAIGGKTTVKLIDEELLDAYKSIFVEHFPFQGEGELERYKNICGALALLNSKDSKSALANWQAELDINEPWETTRLETLRDLSRVWLRLGDNQTESLMQNMVVKAVETSENQEQAREVLKSSLEYFREPAIKVEIEELYRSYKTDSDFGFDTVALMKTLGIAIEAYAVDWAFYPTTSDVSETVPLLSPTYVKSVSANDGWGQKFFVASQSYAYVIVSSGADGRFEIDYSDLDLGNVGWTRGVGTEVNQVGFPLRGPANNLDSDTIYINGNFYRWPEELIGTK